MRVTELGGANRRRVCALVVVVFVALAVSACTKSDPVEASVWDMPEVVWDGAAPSGGVEDTDWAKEFRELQFMRSYASARKDVSYVEYVKTFGYDSAVADADFLVSGYNALGDLDPETGEYVDDAPLRWAAQRMLITSVEEEPGGRSAVIEYYLVIYTSVTFGEVVQHSAARLTHRDDGTVTLEGVKFTGSEEPPAIEDIPTARWATPITKPTLPGEVKMPLPREYYVELGVISE